MPLDAIQDYIFSTLTADPEITSRAGVYDYIPENVRPPFIVIGEGESSPGRTKNVTENQVIIRVISDFDGYQEASEIAEMVNNHFAYTQPTIPGYRGAAFFGPTVRRVATVEDGIREVNITYRVVVQK